MTLNRYFLEISFNGKAFFGWQKQPNHDSIQKTIEDALQKLLQEDIVLYGCGRTDTGVHANQFFAHFEIKKPIHFDLKTKLNQMLNDSISVQNFFKVKNDIHARFTALNRTYRYFLNYDKNPFFKDVSFFVKSYRPDIELMNNAARLLIGKHDFSTFEKKGSDNKNSICDITHAVWYERKDIEGLIFEITANRFLRNMVRRITGALLMIGLERLTIEDFHDKFLNKKNLEVNIAVPAHGLFLWKIQYPFLQ